MRLQISVSRLNGYPYPFKNFCWPFKRLRKAFKCPFGRLFAVLYPFIFAPFKRLCINVCFPMEGHIKESKYLKPASRIKGPKKVKNLFAHFRTVL